MSFNYVANRMNDAAWVVGFDRPQVNLSLSSFILSQFQWFRIRLPRRHFILLAPFGDLSKIDNIHYSNIRTSFGKDFGDEIVKFCEGATEKGRAP